MGLVSIQNRFLGHYFCGNLPWRFWRPRNSNQETRRHRVWTQRIKKILTLCFGSVSQCLRVPLLKSSLRLRVLEYSVLTASMTRGLGAQIWRFFSILLVLGFLLPPVLIGHICQAGNRATNNYSQLAAKRPDALRRLIHGGSCGGWSAAVVKRKSEGKMKSNWNDNKCVMRTKLRKESELCRSEIANSSQMLVPWFLLIFCVASILRMAGRQPSNGKKPNILVIMGDDIGWFNPSCLQPWHDGFQNTQY